MLNNVANPEERGASAVEYGLLIAGIAALIAITVFLFGGGLNEVFNDSCTSLYEETGYGACS